MALVAIDGRWLKVNDTLCKLVGYRHDELLASDFQSITHPDDLTSDLAELARLLAGEIDAYELEKRYIRKDGSTVWILLSVSLVRNDDATPRFFISQIQDVSRRKQAESEVERFFATSKDMLAIAGTSGRLEVISPAWERTLGFSAHELTTRDFMEYVHPDDRAHTRAEAERVYAGHPSGAFRNRYRSKSGDYHWLEWNTTVADDGRLFCVVRDVSARVQEERSRAWLAAIVENASDAIIGVDAGGNIFSWNGGAERLYGYRAAEITGRHITQLAPDATQRAAITGVWERALSGVKHQEYDAARARNDGSLVEVHVQVRAVEGANGSVLGWSVTARDITERKRLADALAQQVELHKAIVRSLPQGSVTVFDRSLRFVAAEGELLRTLGIAREELLGKHAEQVTSTQNRALMLQAYEGALRGESADFEAARANITMLVRIAPLYGANGQIAGGLALSLDVSERKREAEQLRRAKLLLEAAIGNIQDGVALLDVDRRLLLANEAFASLFGIARDKLPGLGRDEFGAMVAERFEDPAYFRERLMASGQGTPSIDELVLREPRRVLRRTLKPVGGLSEVGFLVVWRDITRDSDLLAQRDREALTDALTAIPNRRAAEACLRAELSRANAAGTPLSIALFDIDHFKRINDAHGHATGDLVLQAVAKALTAQARGTDLVARWGGEEFIAVLPTGREGARRFCERAREAVRALVFPGLAAVTVSAGLATSAGESAPQELLQRADARMYEAKANGRDRVVG
jgi:diguanylate cyclase (GGDEF)-like protein/PAS domain S-box-containing protein